VLGHLKYMQGWKAVDSLHKFCEGLGHLKYVQGWKAVALPPQILQREGWSWTLCCFHMGFGLHASVTAAEGADLCMNWSWNVTVSLTSCVSNFWCISNVALYKRLHREWSGCSLKSLLRVPWFPHMLEKSLVVDSLILWAKIVSCVSQHFEILTKVVIDSALKEYS